MTILSVVIPAYNEQDSIADIVGRVLAVQPALKAVGVDGLELLVVDDGSSDQTREIVQRMAEEDKSLRLIGHEANGGYGAALKTGFRQANGDLVGFLDADGTYPPEHFPQLCEAALNKWELVIGSRMAGAYSEMPLVRRVGNIFFANLLSLIGRQKVTDSASGMRVFHKSILQRLSPLPDGLNLTPVMSTRAIHENIRIMEIPIPYSERAGNSKLSVVHDGSLFLRSMVWTAMKYNPIRVLGLFGLAGLGVATAVALWLIFARMSGVTTINPIGVSTLFLGAIAGFIGISLLSLGSTFNSLVAIFHKQSVRQGLFGKPHFRQISKNLGLISVVSLLIGVALGIGSISLSLSGVELNRLWLYFMGSGMFILIGVQMLVSWTLLRVLDELNTRETRIEQEEVYSLTNISDDPLRGVTPA